MEDELLLEQLLALMCTRKDPSAQLKMPPQHQELCQWHSSDRDWSPWAISLSSNAVAYLSLMEMPAQQRPNRAVLVHQTSDVLVQHAWDLCASPHPSPGAPSTAERGLRASASTQCCWDLQLPCSKAKSMLQIP